MTFNSSLADAVIGWIEAHPERHNQRVWIATDVPHSPQYLHLPLPAERETCGTTACFAGWTVILGKSLKMNDLIWEYDAYSHSSEPITVANGYRQPGQYSASVAGMAMRMLGLTDEQAAELFFHDNSVERIKMLCKHYTDNPGVTYREWTEANDDFFADIPSIIEPVTSDSF